MTKNFPSLTNIWMWLCVYWLWIVFGSNVYHFLRSRVTSPCFPSLLLLGKNDCEPVNCGEDFGAWIIAWRRAAWWAETLHFRLSFKWEITCIVLISCLHIIMNCVMVISKHGYQSFLHSWYTSVTPHIKKQSLFASLNLHLSWLAMPNRMWWKRCCSSGCKNSYTFYFLLLGTQTPHWEKLTPHGDSHGDKLRLVIGPSWQLGQFSSMCRSWLSPYLRSLQPW